ncbi:hypothetical protein EZV62_003941 [Acer yangbiense]|uniref:Uncharacterized protein n=1 Tax=Acer yangbiense TaxID=1000413 RepID=A0A5C7IKN1_9ROSI|nr:hypothetical protein EZV62_003941 [Acer yangbiense]
MKFSSAFPPTIPPPTTTTLSDFVDVLEFSESLYRTVVPSQLTMTAYSTEDTAPRKRPRLSASEELQLPPGYRKAQFYTLVTQSVKAYIQFLTLPNNASTINYLEMMRLDNYAALQFSKWYFNYATGAGAGSTLISMSPDLWDGDFEASQIVIQHIIEGIGFVAEDFEC